MQVSHHNSATATDAYTSISASNNNSASRLLLACALMLLAVTLVSAPAFAQSINGSFDGVGTLTPTGTPGIFTQNFTGDGNDNVFGAFTATSTSTVDFTSPPNIVITNAMLTQIFAGGSLFGDGSGSGTANGHGSATFTSDFIITGGTGIFEHLHGDVIITGTITQLTPLTEAVDATYTGNLATPEPSSLGLLLMGAGVGYRFITRKRLK